MMTVHLLLGDYKTIACGLSLSEIGEYAVTWPKDVTCWHCNNFMAGLRRDQEWPQ